MGIWKLYAESFAHWLSGGSLVLRDNMSSLGIKAAYDRFLTKKYVTKVWIVRALPVNFRYNLSELIRHGMFESNPSVRTTIQYINIPTNPEIRREIFKRQLRSAEEKYETFKGIFDEMSEGERLMGKSFNLGSGRRFTLKKADIDRIKDRYQSYTYVYRHRTKAKPGEFFKTYIFIQASAPSNEEMAKFRDKLNLTLEGYGVYATEVKGNVSSYLTNFGPATYKHTDMKAFTTNLMSDENLSYSSPYRTRGLVGGVGALLGLDWLSRLPVIVDFFATSAAQIVLLCAKSGWGKTLAAQMMIMALASDSHDANIVDIKGGEWIKLSHFFDSILNIDVDGFVNTMRLDDMEIAREDAAYMFEMAVSATVQVFSIMTQLDPDNEGNPADLDTLLGIAVRKVYSQITGFREDNPDTFHLTKDLKYEMVLDVLNDLRNASSFEKQKGIIPYVVTRCSVFLSTKTKQNKMFRKEIRLADVLNSKIVVYSLNKNTDPIMTVMDDLRVFMCTHLSRKKHYVRKKLGKHTVEVFEEVQRTEEDTDSRKRGMSPQLIKHISHVTTGSRSDNVMVIALLNSLSTFNRPETKPIKSNITTVIAGKMNSEDIQTLVEDFDCGDIENYLTTIASGDPEFENAFAMHFDNGKKVDKALYKVILPDHMEKELRQRDRVVETIKGAV